MERTFQRAGENRAELEKVLRHYEDDDVGRKSIILWKVKIQSRKN